MSRARVHSARLVIAVILGAGLMAIPVPTATAGHARSSAGAGNELLRQFPLGSRRLCCTTRTGSGAASSAAGSTRSRSGGGNGAAASSGASHGGHGGGSAGVVLAVIALLVAVLLGGVAARGRSSRRSRPRTPTAAADRGGAGADRSVWWMRNPVGARDVAPAPAAHNEFGSGRAAVADDQFASGQAAVADDQFASGQAAAADDQFASGEAVPATGPGGPAGGWEVNPATGAGIPTGKGAKRSDDARGAAEEFDLGLELHRSGQLHAAALAYLRAEERGMPEAAFNLGVLLYESGDLARAEATWRRCLKYEHARAATNLGFLFEQRGDVRNALLAYSVGERWGDPEGRRLGAALLQRAGDLPPRVRGAGS